MKRNYLVGYDISDQKRLARVAKVVSGFGYRIQYSFFHCILSENEKKKMKGLLKKRSVSRRIRSLFFRSRRGS